MPEGQEPSRRYADVCHINPDEILDPQKGPAKVEEILAYAKKKGVALSSLVYCGNPLKEAKEAIWLIKVIQAAAQLRIPVVTCFVGRDKDKNLDESFERFVKAFKPIVDEAENRASTSLLSAAPYCFQPQKCLTVAI